MRVSLVQVESPAGEPVAARRERVGQLVAEARGADLVVLPELWAPGYFAFDRYPERAEPLDGDTVQAGREWARDLGCLLHLGSVLERDTDGRLYNTALLIDATGAIVHRYRKIHVFGYRSREAELVTPGQGVTVTRTALGPTAATTCYDLRFPELWRALVDAGAETVVVPAAWPAARRHHWRLFTSCRAVEEQIVLVACNAVGTQSGTVLGGYSRVVDPWGEVLVEADDREGITSCEVDLDVVARARTEFPVLRDRRLALPAGDQRPDTSRSTH
ncbi:carbon-nitrogen family hydrolase [Micromonospora echinofusca]|uniref:Carbon-nitrogen family hydrolase n=1 Tax=Micromonospora echinofusca TaxID=47858 RepID=A0ABS3W190_MICEH|nr:carbon-nitrogen family hydrolase [Micromonospora echinofusca]MBO4210545.1 carbon-nitrogen family hydrolase [Micromonospora echinofusca]